MAFVIIVDDQPPVAIALARLVRSLDHEAAIAYGGVEALRLLRRRPADLLMLDASMPGLSALDVLRVLRTDVTYPHVPVIVFPARVSVREEAIALGASAFVRKPEGRGASPTRLSSPALSWPGSSV